MAIIRWIKDHFGHDTNRFNLMLDSVDILAENMAPRIRTRMERQTLINQFRASLMKHTDLPEDNITS